MKTESIKKEVLDLLRDGHWHRAEEMIQFGWSFRNRISELRQEGYNIISEKQEGHPTFRYRLIGESSKVYFEEEDSRKLLKARQLTLIGF